MATHRKAEGRLGEQACRDKNRLRIVDHQGPITDMSLDSSIVPRNQQWYRYAASISVTSDIDIRVVAAKGVIVSYEGTEVWKYWPPLSIQTKGSAKKGYHIELLDGTIIVTDPAGSGG
ncbi:hypothetical protein JMJ77_0013648 [Colletotrichum scovillei]|uniref:Uncharacterized protein n=1 Tax=Colletotrichum scovillei TaxID=1209932 RepID=A0A9P7QSD9_9PEZI|nr:hypothetical protein JMJ78_0012937 [Colletotrichum scovillei]KAG7040651.1 hypothetical protein JMJ77_0013648 [Colletotrichum scovillei]KAG7060698.1 hypothetical protein JMJ76_0006241 [Colletotrichum scovillei]